MTRDELVARYRELQAESVDLLALWLEDHPNEDLTALCRECDEENWNALRRRVQRARKRLKVSTEAESAARAQETQRVRRSHAKSVLQDADERTVEEIVANLPAQAVERIAKAVEPRVREARATERADTVERNKARGKADPAQEGLRRKQVVLDVNYELSTARVAIENGSADYVANEEDFDAEEREHLLRRLIGIRDAVNAFSVMVDTGDLGLADEISAFLAGVSE